MPGSDVPGSGLRAGSSAAVDAFPAERFRINLAWCIRLRWAAAAGQLATIGFVRFGLELDLPYAYLLAILAAEVVLNVALEVAYRRRSEWSAPRTELLFIGILGIDLVFLTALLFFTGGPFNPFVVFYLVNLTLAAEVLSPRSTWWFCGFALICFFGLSAWHWPLPELAEDRSLTLGGRTVAIAAAGTILIYLLTRLTGELELRERELDDARRRQEESLKLSALATLAAGAAHELASPLSTIAVVAMELERSLEGRGEEGSAVDDVRLVRREVDRCREILDRMGAGASDTIEPVSVVKVSDLIASVLDAPRLEGRVRCTVEPSVADLEYQLPRSSIEQALRALLHNAVDASTAEGDVEIRFEERGDALEIAVQDEGEGMTSETLARAADPFFTTKEPGKGTGLGLFIAKATVEHVGGELTLSSAPSTGTRVVVTLPKERLAVP